MSLVNKQLARYSRKLDNAIYVRGLIRVAVSFCTGQHLTGYEMKTFHSFRLDTTNHCLWHGEDRAGLPPKAFDVLRYLVEHAGRLVTPDEILEALWSETYVNPEGLRRYIQEIRKVLKDRADKPIFIETLPKRGYQFVAPVIEECLSNPLDLPVEAAKKIVGR